jgi:hypothetical protein
MVRALDDCIDKDTDDGLRMVMETVFLVVAGGITIWMRSSSGRVAERRGRVSSMP